MEGVPNWELTSENQHTFRGTEEKTDSTKCSTVKNPTFTYDLTTNSLIKGQNAPTTKMP